MYSQDGTDWSATKDTNDSDLPRMHLSVAWLDASHTELSDIESFYKSMHDKPLSRFRIGAWRVAVESVSLGICKLEDS